ncbi:hypothetical protein NUSPORA_00950 [Nucleospora cyclopteri]
MGLYRENLNLLSSKKLIDLIYNFKPFNRKIKEKSVGNQLEKCDIRKIALRMSYDGRKYAGVQENTDGYSISEALLNALKLSGLFVENNGLVFCGRTDAGVSGKNMIVSLFIKCRKQESNNDLINRNNTNNSDLINKNNNITITSDLININNINNNDLINKNNTSDLINTNNINNNDLINKNNNINNTSDLINTNNINNKNNNRNNNINNIKNNKNNNINNTNNTNNNQIMYFYNNKKYYKYIFNQSEFEITDRDRKEWPFNIILNGFLPDDIKITGWAPIPDLFSARHNCRQRHYKYFFVLKNSDQNITDLIKKYNEIAERVKKFDDFYYLSKHSNPTANYKMKLDFLEFSQIKNNLCVMEIKAYSFLHNMVRKIFYYCNRYVETNRTDFKCVLLAEPENLMFFGCKYDNELKFICKNNQRKFNKTVLKKGKTVEKMLEYEMWRENFGE